MKSKMNECSECIEIENETPIRRRINVLITVLLVFAVLLCLWVTFQVIGKGYVNLFGYSLFRVVTGSMEPTIPVGSLLVCKHVGMEAVQSEDIICFRAQESAIFGQMMTHRVTGVFPMADGSLLFETRGDANLTADGFLVSQTNFVGKVIWHTGASSVLSSILSFCSNKIGFLACIVVPILILGGLLMKDCVNNIRSELQKAMDELERGPVSPEPDPEPLLELTEEERQEMYERIRAEVLEELMKGAAEQSKTD